MFLLVVFLVFWVPRLLIMRNDSLFLDFRLLIFLHFVFFCLYFLVVLLFVSFSCLFSSSYVSFSTSLTLLLLFLIHVFLFVCVYLVWLFLLLFFLFFIFVFSPPPAHLKRKTMEITNISLCLLLGDLCESVLSRIPVSVFFCGFHLSTKHVGLIFLEYVLREWGFFFTFYLLLLCCFGVWKRAFFRSNFSLVPGFFGLVVFSVRVLLIFMFLLVWCFIGSGLSIFNSLRHLGIVLSSLR